MELREFVRETLTAILAGIREAQDVVNPFEGRQGVVNPGWNDTSDMPDHVQSVSFDVAVTASDQSTMGGKGGIKVWAAEIGGQMANQTENSTISRVSFSVPILPPTTTVRGVNKPNKSPVRSAAQ